MRPRRPTRTCLLAAAAAMGLLIGPTMTVAAPPNSDPSKLSAERWLDQVDELNAKLESAAPGADREKALAELIDFLQRSGPRDRLRLFERYRQQARQAPPEHAAEHRKLAVRELETLWGEATKALAEAQKPSEKLDRLTLPLRARRGLADMYLEQAEAEYWDRQLFDDRSADLAAATLAEQASLLAHDDFETLLGQRTDGITHLLVNVEVGGYGADLKWGLAWSALWRGATEPKPQERQQALAKAGERFEFLSKQRETARLAVLGSALVEAELGRADDAIKTLEGLTADAASDGPARLALWHLARVQLSQSRYADAVAALDRFAKLPPAKADDLSHDDRTGQPTALGVEQFLSPRLPLLRLKVLAAWSRDATSPITPAARADQEKTRVALDKLGLPIGNALAGVLGRPAEPLSQRPTCLLAPADVALTGSDEWSVFGLRSSPNAKQTVFAVDRSGSMDALGDFLKLELARATYRMPSSQKFNIIWFSEGDSFKLFNRMAPATLENKRRALRHLAEIQFRGSTNPTSAVMDALNFKPQQIVVMTDGNFDSEFVDAITKHNLGRRRIHCVGFVLPHGEGHGNLKKLAEQNEGQFAPVDPVKLSDK